MAPFLCVNLLINYLQRRFNIKNMKKKQENKLGLKFITVSKLDKSITKNLKGGKTQSSIGCGNSCTILLC